MYGENLFGRQFVSSSFLKKKDFCCFGYVTQSLLHSFVN